MLLIILSKMWRAMTYVEILWFVMKLSWLFLHWYDARKQNCWLNVIQLLVAKSAERPGSQVVLVPTYPTKNRFLRDIIARSALYVPLPKNVPWTDSVLLLLQIIITFCGRQMGCVTALLPFGSLKEIFWELRKKLSLTRIKDRIHFLTQASAGFEIRPKMVFLGSGKLKTMFYDDFEQHEKIEFVDFL